MASGDENMYWVAGGFILLAGALVFVFREQICQNIPDIPLLCKPFGMEGGQKTPELGGPGAPGPSGPGGTGTPPAIIAACTDECGTNATCMQQCIAEVSAKQGLPTGETNWIMR